MDEAPDYVTLIVFLLSLMFAIFYVDKHQTNNSPNTTKLCENIDNFIRQTQQPSFKVIENSIESREIANVLEEVTL